MMTATDFSQTAYRSKSDSINPDTDANLAYYGESYTMKQIISGEKVKAEPDE